MPTFNIGIEDNVKTSSRKILDGFSIEINDTESKIINSFSPCMFLFEHAHFVKKLRNKQDHAQSLLRKVHQSKQIRALNHSGTLMVVGVRLKTFTTRNVKDGRVLKEPSSLTVNFNLIFIGQKGITD